MCNITKENIWIGMPVLWTDSISIVEGNITSFNDKLYSIRWTTSNYSYDYLFTDRRFMIHLVIDTQKIRDMRLKQIGV
jgi:hypothetical protein